MLRVCENVQEAMAHSRRWQIPLLVLVHSSDAPSGSHTGGDDIPGLHNTNSSGKRTVNAMFQLGGGELSHDGAAQRQALEAVLHESRLAAVTVVHFMEAGSAAHNLFTTAVPESSQVVPRLHVFPSSLRKLPRAVLHGAALTPGGIYETTRLALQMPPLSKVTESIGEFVQQVEEMNAAVRQTSTSGPSVFFTPRHAAPTPGRGVAGSEATTRTAGGVSTAAAAAVANTGGGGAPCGLHFIAINGLAKKEVVVTSPGMTLRTVWQKVQQALQRERETAKLGSRPYDGTMFVLRVEPPPATCVEGDGAGSTPVVVKSLEEAAKINIHVLPHNTVVTVIKDDNVVGTSQRGDNSSCWSGKQADATEVGDQNERGRAPAGLRCEGGTCRLRSPHSKSEMSPATGTKQQPQQQQQKQEQQQGVPSSAAAVVQKKEETKAPPSAGVTARINLRCSLPDGSTHTVDDLDPAVATLSTHVRGQIAALVGHDVFVFARAYPPRRFTSEEETSTLESVGLRTSSALRVVPTAGHSSAATNVAPHHVDATAGGLLGLVSSMLRRSTGSAAAAVSALVPPSSTGVVRGGGGRPAHSSRFRTMAEIRAEEEEEENRRAAMADAKQDSADGPRRKKANRYYGGDSTEYTDRAGSDSEEDDGARDNKASNHAKKNT